MVDYPCEIVEGPLAAGVVDVVMRYHAQREFTGRVGKDSLLRQFV